MPQSVSDAMAPLFEQLRDAGRDGTSVTLLAQVFQEEIVETLPETDPYVVFSFLAIDEGTALTLRDMLTEMFCAHPLGSNELIDASGTEEAPA